MRDTDVLRHKLWRQLGLPLATAALLSACDGGAPQPSPSKVADGDGSKAEGDAPAEAPARVDTNAAAPGYVPPANIDAIPEGEFDYFGPGRDPYTEHLEEDGCPSGDWCGSPEAARKFAIAHLVEKNGCPVKIIGNPESANAVDQDSKSWKGFSFHPMMQGRLMTSVTEEARQSGKADTCCYHWFEYCSGRPLLDGDDMILAELQPGASWCCDPIEVAAHPDHPDEVLPRAFRERLGELWVQDARMEHAAIAAFMRATLELMAMAGPSELLAELQQAAQDEVVHAQRCFGFAARFSGQARQPGALTTLAPRVADPSAEADWVRLAVDTFVEGCVGETIATLVARRGLRHCDDPATVRTLEEIVEDEGQHAGLAWRTVSWILDEGAGDHREAVLRALRAQAGSMAERTREACEPAHLPAPDEDAALLARYGRLDRRVELGARRDAWEELILPTLEALAPTPGSGSEARA